MFPNQLICEAETVPHKKKIRDVVSITSKAPDKNGRRKYIFIFLPIINMRPV